MKKIIFSVILSTMIVIPVFSYTTYEVPEGLPHYKFNIYDQGETGNIDEASWTSTYNFTNNQMSALFDAAKKWTEYINFNPNNLPAYNIFTSDDLNASAISPYAQVEGSDYLYTLINAMMTNKEIIPEEGDALPNVHGVIEVGLGLIEEYPKWSNYAGPTTVFKDSLPDIYSTMIHEMYHSIGLASDTSQYYKEDGDDTFYFSKDINSPISIWDSYLRIYKGDVSSSSTYNPELEIAANRGMSLNIDLLGNGTFDIFNYTPYFAGKETLKVLTGLNTDNIEDLEGHIMSNGGLRNYSDRYSSAGYPLVLGLPVNVIEKLSPDSEKYRPELSHIELRNSFMSHQRYQNWAILMEAEMAVLKDLGYDVDLRKYFGQSYYLDNLTENFIRGYGEIWDGSTYSGRSTIENGIGLHIYGNNNIITQSSNILSDGNYTIGARIDGVNNKYTLDEGYKIDTTGKSSIGIAATWGKNHEINLKQNSSVTATGNNGIAASFDFGKNVMGGLDDDRGSYSTYSSYNGENLIPEDVIKGPLVKNFNIEGNLEGKKTSIYISENAHVENINIKDGAIVKGDIISEWNSIKSGVNMYVQDSSGNFITGDDLSKVYFTNLNFENGSTPHNFSYNIIGSSDTFNTIKMNNNGILNFGNSADTKKIDVFNITNNGTLNLIGNTSIITQDGAAGISGGGTINVSDGKSLEMFNVLNIGNNLYLNAGELDTSNTTKENITVNKLVTSDGSKLDIDLGDTFNISDISGSSGTTEISSIYAEEEEVLQMKELGTDYAKSLFTDKTLNLGTSETNVYYGGKKYTLSQDATGKDLIVNSISTSNGVADAAQDQKTANYIVSQDEVQDADGGVVTGKTFEVSGNNLDFNGHKGLIVDGSQNSQGTTIKTSTYGAAEGGAYKGIYTVQNNGLLRITSDVNNPEIAINSDNNAIYLDNTSNVQLLSENGSKIKIEGNITGESFDSSKVFMMGDTVSLDKINNVYLDSRVNHLELNDQISNTKLNALSGNIYVAKDSVLAGGTNAILLNGADINLQNGEATPIDLSNLYLNENTNLKIDVDIINNKADTFTFTNEDNAVTNYGTITIDDVNFPNINERTILEKDDYAVPIISSIYKNTALRRSVNFAVPNKSIMTPIFKYNTAYSTLNDGSIAFGLSKAGSGYDSFNPAVVTAPVAAQFGGYLNQLNSYEHAFQNMDMRMLLTREQRQAYKIANRYASTVTPTVFSPIYIPENDKGAWFRPYATFEKVDLKNGPEVENISYGSYFGGDSPIYELKRGWDFQYSAYVGYNGSHQNYNGNSIYQNGGTIGATGIFYKDNFFTALTANVGASVADTSTMYGSEDFPMLMTGVASKTGYNWELAKGKFIIQPSYLMSYTFVNTFDYKNAAGVNINSDSLHAINIAPGLKFIGNLKNGWQPYVSMRMVWNIMDKTHFHANDVALPQMSVKPYFQYGVGVQKRWGERFTGFLQAMVRNGGRNGVALSAGFRWALGKEPDKTNRTKITHPNKKTIIKKAS